MATPLYGEPGYHPPMRFFDYVMDYLNGVWADVFPPEGANEG